MRPCVMLLTCLTGYSITNPILKIEEHYTDTAKSAARLEGAFISRRRLFSSCFFSRGTQK
jgi:hypothetical protein